MSSPATIQFRRRLIFSAEIMTGIAIVILVSWFIRNAVDYASLSGSFQHRAAAIYTAAIVFLYLALALLRLGARVPSIQEISFGSASGLVVWGLFQHFDVPARDSYAVVAVIFALIPGLLASLPLTRAKKAPQPVEAVQDVPRRTEEEHRTWMIAGMRKSAARAFRDRRNFPLGSQERQNRRLLIQSAKLGIRSLAPKSDAGADTEFLSFEFDTNTADAIEAIAQKRGISISEFLTETMRVSFWRYGFAEGIKIIEAARLKAEEEAREQLEAEQTPFTEGQARAVDFARAMLADAAASIHEECNRTGAELPHADLDRLQQAIEAAAAVAASLKAQADATGWTMKPDERGVELGPRPAGQGFQVEVYRERSLVARVLLPSDVSVSKAEALTQHLFDALTA